MAYKSLISEGESYRIKNSISFMHLIIVAWLLIGITLVIYSTYLKTGMGIIAFTALILILTLLRPTKTRIFPEKKVIQIDAGVRGKEPEHYNFADFEGFDLQVIKWIMGIPLNASLHVHFKNGDKLRRYELGASLSKKKMQRLHNELEEIINKQKI